MIQKLIIFTSFLFSSLISFSANSTTLVISAATGIIDETYDGCTQSSDGTIASDGSSTLCQAKFPLPLSALETITAITFYYYDNSGSVFFYGGLIEEELAVDTYSAPYSYHDTRSSSVQSSSLTFTSTLSAADAYTLYVTLGYSTKLRGIIIEY